VELWTVMLTGVFIPIHGEWFWKLTGTLT
jgi:hypothetical protein